MYNDGLFSKAPKTLNKNHYSKKEKKLCESIIEMMNYDKSDVMSCVSSDKQLELYSKKYRRRFIYDFSYKNKIIEFNGDFWHAWKDYYAPKRYMHDNLCAEDIWEIDARKAEEAQAQGYDILVIWKHDFDKNETAVLEQCKQFLTDAK